MAGPDAYFHLRHTEAVLKHYPVIERFDFMTNFPNGETGLNQSFFDVGMATVVKLTGLAPVIVLAWVSPILWMTTGIWCYFWLSRGTNWRCGAIFLALLLLYPGAMCVMGALGQGDHHAAEVFLATAVAWTLDRLLRSSTSWYWAPVAASPLIIFYLSWAGAPLHLLIVGAVLYMAAWKPRETAGDQLLALKGAVYGLTVLIAVGLVDHLLPWAVVWETSQRAFYVGTLLLTMGYPFLIPLTRRRWRRRWLTVLLLPVVPLSFALLAPVTREQIRGLLDTRTNQIAEHVTVSFQLFWTLYGPIWVLAILAVLKIWKQGAGWMACVPLVYGSGLVLAWLQTRDFIYYPPVLVAASAAYFVEGLVTSRKALLVGAIILSLPPLIPETGVQRPWIVRSHFREIIVQTDGLDQAAQWLKQSKGDLTPDSEQAYGLVAPWDLGNMLAQAGETPVGWSQTVSSELAGLMYSDNPDETYTKLTTKTRPFRYVLVPARNLSEKFIGEMMSTPLNFNDMLAPSRSVNWKGQDMWLMDFTPRSQSTILYRLYWATGQGLGHYRMVFESPTKSLHAVELIPRAQQFQFTSFPLTEKTKKVFQPLLDSPDQPMETSRGDLVNAKIGPEVRIFELVPGALLTGRTNPGSQARASITVRNPLTDEEYRLTYAAAADNNGRFAIRVPYPTDHPMSTAPGTVEVNGLYLVEVDNWGIEMKVTEEAIDLGQEIPLTEG